MNMFRLLNADEIECRIAQIKENGLSLLLYKTARTDANLLDETIGVENWKNDFKVVDGVLYGGIGIYSEKQGEWVWKWDAGTESNTEAEKGRASDAFKRAGFKWGIGRELYTAPFIWISSDKYNLKNGKCYDKFVVKEIGYNEKGEINNLIILNETTGNVVFPKNSSVVGNVSKDTPKPQKAQEKPKEQKTEDLVMHDKKTNSYFARCADCGGIITDLKKKDGSVFTVQDYVAASVKLYGRPVCNACRKKNGKAD